MDELDKLSKDLLILQYNFIIFKINSKYWLNFQYLFL